MKFNIKLQQCGNRVKIHAEDVESDCKFSFEAVGDVSQINAEGQDKEGIEKLIHLTKSIKDFN